MSSVTVRGSTLGVLARQEIGNYLKHKLFWFSGAVTLFLSAWQVRGDSDTGGESTVLYMIGPAAMLGLLGLVTMFSLTRRSDRAAEAAGAVAVPERVRTLALACAVVVPLSFALVCFATALIEYYTHPPADYTVPPGVSDLFVHAQQFGGGVVSAVGGPLLGLLLARYLPRRGVAAIATVLVVLVTILLQGVAEGGQPYRVFWVWTYFVGQVSTGWDFDYEGATHWATAPGNPYLWVLYLVVLCVLGVVLAARHDPEADRFKLKWIALGLGGLALLLGVLTMTVGFTEVIINPIPCASC
ncbi:MAG: hypothetical protein HZY75_01625 [Nocardioidaceae bacterium]|nr:MAG: hypothetical protein HZY75_01625 [Nocardioidaceae bacterium]